MKSRKYQGSGKELRWTGGQVDAALGHSRKGKSEKFKCWNSQKFIVQQHIGDFMSKHKYVNQPYY